MGADRARRPALRPGAADDKAGIAAHLGAVRIFGDDLPVNLVMFIEGEEEVGSDTLVELLEAHKERLAADVIVIADSGNWDIGEPALTTRRCAAWSGWTSRSARSPTPSTAACGAAWCPTRS